MVAEMALELESLKSATHPALGVPYPPFLHLSTQSFNEWLPSVLATGGGGMMDVAQAQG